MIFTFKNKETGEYFEQDFRGNTEKEEFLEENKNYVQILTPVGQASPYSLGLKKTDGAFRDVMSNIKRNNRSVHTTMTTGNLSQI